jgi:hypothetical protein
VGISVNLPGSLTSFRCRGRTETFEVEGIVTRVFGQDPARGTDVSTTCRQHNP